MAVRYKTIKRLQDVVILRWRFITAGKKKQPEDYAAQEDIEDTSLTRPMKNLLVILTKKLMNHFPLDQG